MISLIHPSRGRAIKARKAFDNWTSNAGGDFNNPIYINHILSLDSDDPSLNDYYPWLGNRTIINNNRSAVDAINNAAKVAKADIFIVMSDDFVAPKNWAVDLIKIVSNKKDFILKTQDGIQPWIITNPIMDRVYYNRFGYIYHPDYLHMFCDTELSCVADITGRKIKSNLLFPHKHYSVTKEQPDEINKKADSTWDQGEKLFLERYKRNFDLPPGKPIEDNGMIRFLQRKAR